MRKIKKSEWDKMSEDEKRHLELLYKIDKENFRQKLLYISRIIAVFLVFAIIWIGYIQMMYVQDINVLREDMGSQAWCYLCGKETLKKCECQYFDRDLITYDIIKIEEVRNQTMEYNKQLCKMSKTGFDIVNQNITIYE